MFQVLLVFTIAIGVGLGASGHKSSQQKAEPNDLVEQVELPALDSLLDGTKEAPASLLEGTSTSRDDTVVVEAQEQWQPESQEPTGKFTTAFEVKPILMATKANWAAIREYEGNDLLYLTHLVAWRCGLHEIRFGVNGAAEQLFEVEECYENTAQPNSMKMETHLPYVIYGLDTLNTISVTLVFDDGSEESTSYQRSDILMP